GFAESVVGAFPMLNIKLVGIITTVAVAVLALVSAKAAIRAQYFIMFGIVLSLLSLYFGRPVEQSNIEMWGAVSSASSGLWAVSAVRYPAATGIMAGVPMSGELECPSKSIPNGTFAASGVAKLIYMSLVAVPATRADALTLIENPLLMRDIAYWRDA